jgi:hypothetical protein
MGLLCDERVDDLVARVKSPDEESHFVRAKHEIHLENMSI